MLFTVSTVKDTRANVERFVSRNLAGGADHVFLFLDAPEPEVEAYLGGHPQVTHVVCDETYWKGQRPEDLNARQVLNANLVNGVLAPFAWADWLFQIDADEVLDIDRARLLAEVSGDEPFVVLGSTEAVSKRHWDGEVTHFKRLLSPEELELLVALDVIPKADNRDYFRGHTHGKPGIRPSLEHRLQLHRVVVDEDLEPVPPVEADWLRVLHFESYDGEEFVRKWMAHVTAGPLRFRPNRERLLTALTALAGNDKLTDERRHHYLMRLYERWVEDDFETLDDLGLLFTPAARDHTPERFPPGAREEMELLLAVLARGDKRHPHPQHRNKRMVDLLRSVRGDLPGPLADKVAAEVKRAEAATRAASASRPEGTGESAEPAEGRRPGLAGRFGRKA